VLCYIKTIYNTESKLIICNTNGDPKERYYYDIKSNNTGKVFGNLKNISVEEFNKIWDKYIK
jgi:uncharacterized protein YabN with tetrapyrrole methylase and pyrophosphatase domain